MSAAPPPAPPPPDSSQPSERQKAVNTLILGSVFFGGAYVATIPITAAASDGDATGLSAIPIAGPFVIMGEHDLTGGGVAFYALSGAFQAAGMVGIVLGIVGVATADDPPPASVAVAPIVGDHGERGAGLWVRGVTF